VLGGVTKGVQEALALARRLVLQQLHAAFDLPANRDVSR